VTSGGFAEASRDFARLNLNILGMRRESLPRESRVWLHLAIAALLLNVLPFSLFAFGVAISQGRLGGNRHPAEISLLTFLAFGIG
jgi:hypothetical protein